MKPIEIRLLADDDVEHAIQFYRKESTALAARFVDDLEQTFEKIARRPSIGSSLYADELRWPDLRFRAAKHFPYLVFYVEQEMLIAVIRVLHSKRDIPALLGHP